MCHLTKKKLIRLLLSAAVVALIITQTGCADKEVEPVEQESYYLDTVCDVSVYEINGGLNKDAANAAIDKAYDRCRQLDKKLSNTVESSDISKINDAGGEWVIVGDDAAKVIKEGIKYGRLSGGAFDITIGTVTDLWDFQTDDPKLPDDDKLTEALAHVDYHKINVDGNRIRLEDPEAKLDLGGIAKGYVADEMEKVLKKEGVTSAIINLGGNIVAIGSKPDGDDFVIGIEKPFSDRKEIVGTTHVHDATVVTSGIYERKFKYKGKIYHHVLSTKTGYPVDTDLEAVSLVTNKYSSMDADAMSTICLMKGTSAAKKFIKSQDGIEAVFCPAKGDISTTKGMDFTPKK